MIIYRRLEPDDLASLRCFLADNGWSKRVADDDRFRAMIDGADRTDSITWVLRAGRESRGFWERLGFVASEIAMERIRQR